MLEFEFLAGRRGLEAYVQKERAIVCRRTTQRAVSAVIAEFVAAFDVLHMQYGKHPPCAELAKANIGWVRYLEAAAVVRRSGPEGLVRFLKRCVRGVALAPRGLAARPREGAWRS